jgi:F plasmid transfer operon, TraF, protein
VDHGGGRGGTGRLTLGFFTTKDTKDTKAKACTIVFFVSFVSLVVAPTAATAQIYESIGIRAQGMSGAFVAVADDATTTWWNPGGLASGGYFNGIVEFDRTQDPAGTRSRAVAFTIPSLGLSYYRLALNGMRPADSTASRSASREDEGVLSEFGATVGQSVGPHLVLGSTLKLVHALGETRADLDAGAMAALGRVRLGVAVKNLRTPEFSEGDTRFELTRQVRAGAAVKAGATNRAEITAAIDADLTTTLTADGEERHLATGVEAWLVNRSVGVRAGIGMNTIGESRRSGSVGASVGLRGGFYLDGQLTRGADLARNGWGFDLRVTF